MPTAFEEPPTSPKPTQSALGQPDRWQYLAAMLSSSGSDWHLVVGTEATKGKDAWQKLNELGNEGWELVSVVPIVASQRVGSMLEMLALQPKYATMTAGYWLWFKKHVL